MSAHPFDPDFEFLPETLPVFPLTGVLLLPGGRLPLNIFEPRYLAMVDYALRHDRMIGMVQPVEADAGDNEGKAKTAIGRNGNGPAVYPTGCAGRITQFEETDDGRYLILLKGVCRFSAAEEMPLHEDGFRLIAAKWERYRADVTDANEADVASVIDRNRLIPALKNFFRLHGLSADWDAIATTNDERLITTLCMICPFEASEKQALLEAPDLAARADVMQTLIEFAVRTQGGAETPPH